jgi:hypothetical protein
MNNSLTILNNPENFSASSSYINEVKLQIKQLQQLEAGWDFGEGEAISDEVGVTSLEIAEIGLTLGLKADVRPTSEGGIIVSLFYKDHFLFINVKPDGLFDVTYEKGIGVNYEILDNKENLNTTAVRKYLIQWVSSERYIFSNTIKTQNVLPVTHLKSTKTVVSQFLTNNVQKKQAITPSVPILKHFTILQ